MANTHLDDDPLTDDEADDILSINLNPELAMAVGCLAAQWSRIETYMHLLCIGLLNARGQNAYLLTASLGNKTIADFMNACADGAPKKDTTFAAEMRLIASEFNRLLGIRNRIVHGNWYDSEDDESMVTFVARFKGRVHVIEEVWSIGQIEKTIDDCLEFTGCVLSFVSKHYLDLPLRRWMREASRAEFAPRRPAAIPDRDPKMTELVRLLLT